MLVTGIHYSNANNESIVESYYELRSDDNSCTQYLIRLLNLFNLIIENIVYGLDEDNNLLSMTTLLFEFRRKLKKQQKDGAVNDYNANINHVS